MYAMPNFEETFKRPGLAPRLTMLGVYLVSYVVLDWVSYVYPVVPLGITPWNPPAGLSLFLLLWGGLQYWPALVVAALLADLIVRGAPANVGVLCASALIITACYTVAAKILLRQLRMQTPLESTRDLVTFLVVATIASLVVSVGFVGLYAAIGMVTPADIPIDVLRYWVGDLNGILVLTPALLCLANARTLGPPLSRLFQLEIALQTVSVAAAITLVFVFAREYPFRSFYILFLPLIWISARWGLPGATIVQLMIQLSLIFGVQIADYHSATFVQLQVLMTGLCVTGLTLGAMASHRERLERSLQEKQAALNRAQQLASAGELTSALAHQLNQPMTALSSYVGACQMLAAKPQIDADRLRAIMDKVAAEARRASEVVMRLRDFYQRGVSQTQLIELGALLDNVVQVAQRQADRGGIQIELHQPVPACRVRVDPVQVENALQNVVQNAIDAVLQQGAGRRSIAIAAAADNDRIRIRVRDSGPGVPGDIVASLFEPFNTSKTAGMGMGLAIARSLLRANGGDIELASSDASGATFVITLPTVPRRPESASHV